MGPVPAQMPGRGGVGKGGCRVPGRSRAGATHRTSAASPGAAVSPQDSGQRCPSANTLHKAPCAHAPPCSSSHPAAQAARTRSTCTLPRLAGTPDTRGRHTGRGTTEGHSYVCPYSRTHTQTAGPQCSGPLQAHCTPTTHSHRLPRLHADASEREERLDQPPARFPEAPTRVKEVAPHPDGHPLRALPGSLARTPSRVPPPRTHCWPRCG